MKSLAISLVLMPALLTCDRIVLAEALGGYVVGWGENILGAATGTPHDSPSTGLVSIAGEILTDAISVAAGRNYGLALRSNGTVVGWGWNQAGQATGLPAAGDSGFASGVVTIAGEVLTDATRISAGGDFSLALRSDGTIVGWGNDQDGQLAVPDQLRNIASVAAGWNHCLALKSDRTVVWWGTNVRGEAVPPINLTDIAAISLGSGGASHALALQSDGTVVRWGYDTSVPPGLTDVVAVAASPVGGLLGFSGGHCLALKNDGTIVAWGANASGQANAPAGLSNVVAIAAGGLHSLALTKDGELIAWGDNRFHQTDVPAGLSNVVAIAAGTRFNLAITTNRVVAERILQIGDDKRESDP